LTATDLFGDRDTNYAIRGTNDTDKQITETTTTTSTNALTAKPHL